MNGNKCLMSLNKLEVSVLRVSTLWWDPVLFCFYYIVIIDLLFFYKFIYLFYSFNYNHGQNSLDTFAFLVRFPIHTSLTLPITPQTMLDACIQNCFRVSTLNRVGGGGEGELKENSKRMHCFKREQRNDRKIWILQYCPKDFRSNLVPRAFPSKNGWGGKSPGDEVAFVQDCSTYTAEGKLLNEAFLQARKLL